MSQKKIGAKIVIDGEQEFRSALNQSKNALKEFDSELKLVTSQFKNNEKSMDALKSKQQVYQKQQAELTKQSKLLVDQIQKASQEYKKASEVQEQQAEKVKKLEKALEEAKKEYGDSAEEVQQLERELSDANQEYEKQDRAIQSLSDKITKWNTELNNTETRLVETDRALEETNDSIEHYDSNLNEAENETRQFGIVMGDAATNTESLRVSLGSLVSAQVVVDVLRNCAQAIKEVATAAIDVGAKFTASMSNVEALSGASGEALEQLGNKAREMGSKTIYSASESADAFSYMALAGWDVEQMLVGIEPVLNLAAAANMDLAEASDIVTDYLTAFGLEAEDAAHFSDAMATAMSTSNTTVEMLGESYKNCAATCGSMGIAMEDATAALATMANAGVKGGEAGTALNTILTRLATNTKGCADKLEEYGVRVYDAEGKMNSISSILNGIANAWGDMSQQEQAALAKTVAGVAQYSKFQTIMLGVSEAAKEGGQSFDDYAAALRDCDGAAEQMAKTMQDNLTGDITILKSALEGLGIATEGVFDDSFRDAVQGATDAVARLEKSVSSGDLGVSLANLSDSIAELTSNLIDTAEEGLPGFINGLSWLIDNLDMIGVGIASVTSAWVAYKVATTAAAIATGELTIALEANPIGLAAAAITALVVGMYELCKATEEVTYKKSEEQKETEHLISESETLNSKIRESAEARKEELAQIEAQASASQRLVDELFNEATTQERKAQILAQLKTIYPELNASLNEHGQIIGATKDEMEKYIQTSLQMAKVEAAKEHLTEIAKEQFEAEQKLSEIEEQVADAVLEVKTATHEATEEAKQHVDMNGELVDVYNEYDAAVEGATEGLNGLREQQEETRQTVADLGDEYQRTLDYIGDNSAFDSAADGLNELDTASQTAVDNLGFLQQAYEEAKDAALESIESQIGLFDELSTKADMTLGQISKNLQSQADTMNTYASDIESASELVKEGVLDEGMLGAIMELGVDGAGYLHELVEAAENDSEAFTEAMAKWGEMEEAKQNLADTLAEFETGYSETKDTLLQTQDELNTETQTKQGEFNDSWKKCGDELKSTMDEMANQAGESGKQIGTKALEGMKSSSDPSKAKELGKNFAKGYAEGIKSEIENVKAAASELANAAASATASAQKSNSPSKVAERLGDYFGEGYTKGLENSLSKATAIVSEMIPNNDNIKAGPLDVFLKGSVSGNSTVFNNSITVNGSEDPEAWTQGFIRTLKREARMA